MQSNLIYRCQYVNKYTKIKYDGFYVVTNYPVWYDDDFDNCHMSTVIILDEKPLVMIDNQNSLLIDNEETGNLYMYERFYSDDFWCAIEMVCDRETLIVDLIENYKDWFTKFEKYGEQ